MSYKIIQSNSDVNVIEVDGEVIQLSATINIDNYLANKSQPPSDTDSSGVSDYCQPKVIKSKRTAKLENE